MAVETKLEESEEVLAASSLWSRFQQDQAGAIEKVIGIAIVVGITVVALTAIGLVVTSYVDSIPPPGGGAPAEG